MHRLQQQFPAMVRLNEPLAPYSWWKIGGPAEAFVEVQNSQQLDQVLRTLRQDALPWCLIGRGTNLLFDDAGFRGCVIKMGPGLSKISFNGDCATVEAGCWTPHVALAAARHGLSGIEHTIGIPASFGGLICMNGGSQRKGIGEVTESVTILTPQGQVRTYPHGECDFAYRQSRFQESGDIVLSATLRFQTHRPYAKQRPELLAILRERNRKFPRKLPSCGSVFKSSPELYAAYGPPGKIIEDMGFKGRRAGQIEVSPLHANFIVNLGNGSSADVLSLVNEIRQSVRDKTGVTMHPEFRYVHPTKGIVEV
ncbi:MAG: UDP-N-acetylmuramate dehydrogenase [Verrucomicrobiota bacterium JB024]|nr:UDP-N-acetylmuramate dehydrogenase [Verrucomicrobiota bacterium JB024]